MGQRANNRGRNAELDQKKQRAAGRKQNQPERRAIADPFNDKPAKAQVAGAFGRQAKASRRTSASSRGAGGGGTGMTKAGASAINTPRSSRPARKRSPAR